MGYPLFRRRIVSQFHPDAPGDANTGIVRSHGQCHRWGCGQTALFLFNNALAPWPSHQAALLITRSILEPGVKRPHDCWRPGTYMSRVSRIYMVVTQRSDRSERQNHGIHACFCVSIRASNTQLASHCWRAAHPVLASRDSLSHQQLAVGKWHSGAGSVSQPQQAPPSTQTKSTRTWRSFST